MSYVQCVLELGSGVGAQTEVRVETAVKAERAVRAEIAVRVETVVRAGLGRYLDALQEELERLLLARIQ
jgi:hypothetical protein